MKNRLWTRNFTLLIAASGLGAVGGIAGGFAMSFLVFDETGSTLAAVPRPSDRRPGPRRWCWRQS